MLVKFVNQKKESWADYVETCVYAYNTSKHESSKFTPFEVMFGRKAVLPVDVAGKVGIPDPPDDADYECMMDANVKRLELVKKNILAAQQKQKQIYDRKHSIPETFAVGSTVLRKDFTRKKRKGGKLDYKWLGPYRITHSIGRGIYRLQLIADPKKTVNRVNGVHLKAYKMVSYV